MSQIETIEDFDREIILGTPLKVTYNQGSGLNDKSIEKQFVVSHIIREDSNENSVFQFKRRKVTLFTEKGELRLLELFHSAEYKYAQYTFRSASKIIGSYITVFAHRDFAKDETK